MTATPPQLLDVTVRDGGYLINHKYLPNKVAAIAKGLQDAGIGYAEISHGIGIGGKLMGFPAVADDEALLTAAKEAAPALKLCVFISPVDVSLPLIPALVEFFEIGRIGVSVNKVQEAGKFVQKLKKYQKTVAVQLARSHARPPEEAASAAKTAEEMGADIVYVVDTFGSMLPQEAKDYISAVRAKVKIPIGFHGHNNLGLAIPNTLAAWETGATWLDGSLMSVGRGAGNANLEILIQQLQNRGQLGSVDLKKLCQATEQVVLPIFGSPPLSKYVDLLFGREKLDYSPGEFLELCSSSVGIPLEELLMQIHNKMGSEIALADTHIQAVLHEYGVDYQKMINSLKDI